MQNKGQAMTDDETRMAKAALSQWRDGYFAHLITVSLGLAAETHPEEIRAALSSVFNLSDIKSVGERAMVVVSDAQMIAHQARDEIMRMHLEIESLRCELDGLRHEIERMHAGQSALWILRSLGIRLRYDGGKLRAGPPEKITDHEKWLIGHYRSELVEVMTQEKRNGQGATQKAYTAPNGRAHHGDAP